MTNQRYVIGVDVGTGSVRAGLFTSKGQQVATAKQDIDIFHDQGNRYEQSSEQIWHAVGDCVKQVCGASDINPQEVAGISFDATCSLVVINDQGRGLPVGEHGDQNRDIILWMDHRAEQQASHINDLSHPVLEFVGNRISPEMETPKLMWLKAHVPQTYKQAAHFFDLADFLTWKATGSDTRSACTLTCKWTYLAHESHWDESYFTKFGLDQLLENNCKAIGNHVVFPGTSIGKGLTPEAAAHLGLPEGTAVGAGMIDAHAGGIGSVGASNESIPFDPAANMAYVFGTSACTMTSSVKKQTVPGVWGPYYSAMVPNMWLNEAGQSAAGAAIEHLIKMHPAYPELVALAELARSTPIQWLSNEAKLLSASLSECVFAAKGIHVLPEFLGNRAPLADPEARGAIVGLSLDSSLEHLVRLYIAGICGIGYGLRQIIEAQRQNDVNIERIVISGGAGQDPLIRQTLADATGVPVVAPKAEEPVLLGSAMLAAVASGLYSDLSQAMQNMSSFGDYYQPNNTAFIRHTERYAAYLKLQCMVVGFRHI